MTRKSKLQLLPVEAASLISRMLVGSLIGLILITIFLMGAGDPNPDWGKFWIIKPLIIVPLSGAMGGAFNYFINKQDFSTGWAKALAIILSLIVFIIGLWLGIVLGLDGTWWH